MAAFRRFAAAGLVPSSLIGWELYAYGRKKQEAQEARGGQQRGAPLVEGSTAWLIETQAKTLDLVCFRRKLGPAGPSAALADYASQAADARYPYDGLGVVFVERDGVTRVLQGHMDGSVTTKPLAAVLRGSSAFAEVALVPLAWPPEDRESVEAEARKFAAGAVLRCGGPAGPRPPWDTLRDARLAPLLTPRSAWPAPKASATLKDRVEGAVSPAAALVLEMLCHTGVVAAQYRDRPLVPADILDEGLPLRRGARYSPRDRIDVKAENSVE
mmetsp:Transcript_1764/g.5301  ORF Transcript_1764/g.5301 Transcript_1764/m.5301 type:complete len:271 (+) Transcript_1764:296-1108(+)